jgi:hypothetical protein
MLRGPRCRRKHEQQHRHDLSDKQAQGNLPSAMTVTTQLQFMIRAPKPNFQLPRQLGPLSGRRQVSSYDLRREL